MKLLPSIELLSNILNINKNLVQTGLSQGNIGQVLKGNRKQSGGYKWKYQMNLENR